MLVVDDNPDGRLALSTLLQDEVAEASDGDLGLDAARERKPDLILLDLMMPRMDGFEVATHVRHDERLKDVPIIMITSRTGEKHRERAFDIGVNCYMGKPFQENELLSTIRELLGELQETGDE